jgi:beta-glucosidase
VRRLRLVGAILAACALLGVAPAPWVAEPRPWGTDRWMAHHAFDLVRARVGSVDVLFLGDSITQYFLIHALDEWMDLTVPLGDVVNFGLEGDRTEWLLWRIEDGEVATTEARVVVLMIGTNNLESATPAAIAHGIDANIDAIHALLPQATIVLNALLPRGTPDDPLRAKAAEVNGLIAPFARRPKVRWVNAWARFLDRDGRIPASLMADGLHPTAAGYHLWAKALRPVIEDALAN